MTAIDHILGIGDGTVVSLAEWSPRRRAHLRQLLEVRARLAATAAEQRSHDLPECTDILHVLWAVEETIRESWPQVYYAQFPQWASEEEGMLHELPTQGCSVCAADATYGGVDNQPPEAA